MSFEIVEIKDKMIVGKCIRTTNENMQAIQDIGQNWQDFQSICPDVPNRVDNQNIGLYTDYEGDFTRPYNFIAGCEISHMPSNDIISKFGLVVKNIQAGKYAKFSTRGHVANAVGQLWNEIWHSDLNRKYTTDFEVYHNNSLDINDQIVDVYIAVWED